MERDSRDTWAAHGWLKDARQWAKHLYAYEEMIDDDLEFFRVRYEAGDDAIGAVERCARKGGFTKVIK